MARVSSGNGRLRTVLSEPLLQFAVLGLVFFAAHRWWGTGDAAADPRIVVDSALVAHQRQLYQVQFGAPPDPQTLDSLLQRYTREEALYREGMRLHLDAGDEVIRQRVVQKMETLLADAEVIPEPTLAQLHDFHQRNAPRYTEPGEASFRQLYFSIDSAGAAAAETRARAALAILSRDPEARVQSDPLAIGDRFAALDATEVARRFGNSPFARAVGTAQTGIWSGPHASGFGIHLLRVDSRREPRAMPLESVQARVREDYLGAARDAARERRVAAITARFRIVRTDAD